jgi:hypothetical protein
VPAALVSGRENRDELATCKALEAIHDTLVRTDDAGEAVLLEKFFDPVRALLDDVARAVGVTHRVGLDAKFTVVVSGIRPEDVHDQLLNIVDDFMHNF